MALQMGFRDVALLLSHASFFVTFLGSCFRGKNLITTTCPKTVIGDWQGHAPCETSLIEQILRIVSVKFHRDHKTVTNLP